MITMQSLNELAVCCIILIIMSRLHNSMELWLVAERQQMAQLGAATAFLSNKTAMLDAIQFDPNDPRNTGATKARSHIDQCGMLLNQIETYDLDPQERYKKLGDLASKTLKVASGYSMRAGYFHPTQPEGLYRDRMVKLIDDSGKVMPVLGLELASLESTALNLSHASEVQDITDAKRLFSEGQNAASGSDYDLRELYLSEIARDEKFSGTVDAQKEADSLTIATKGLFVAISAGVIRLQQAGPDNLGPIILEPKSDANANFYLRVEDLQPITFDQVTQVTSRDTIARL